METRYKRKLTKGQWAYGMVGKETRKWFLVAVEDYAAKTHKSNKNLDKARNHNNNWLLEGIWTI